MYICIMETTLAKKLKEVLNNLSKEQVQDSWSLIQELNLEGPSLREAMSYVENIELDEYVSSFDLSELQFNSESLLIGENNYNLAA